MYRRNKQARLLTGGLIGALPVTTPGDEYWDDVTLLLDGSSLTDASTAGNNFSLYGNAAANNTGVSDPYGGTKGSFIFDGSGDALTSTNGDIIGIANPFTVEMWVRPDSTSTYQYLDIYGPNTGTGTGWTSGGRLLELNASTTSMQLQWWDGSTSKYNLLMPNTMSVSTWHHVAVVYDGTGMEVYVDGSSIGSMTGATTDGSATNTVFGIYNTGVLPFDGRMHDIRITKGVARYTADFTPPTASFLTNAPVVGRRGVGTYDTGDEHWDDVKLLLNGENATIADASSASTALTVGSSVSQNTSVYKYGSGSLRFTNSGAGGAAGNSIAYGSAGTGPTLSGDYTVEFWFRPDNLLSSSFAFDDNIIWDSRNASKPNYPALIYSGYAPANFPRLMLFIDGAEQITSSQITTAQQWYHVALVRSGGTYTLYLDGASQGTYGATASVSSTYYIGRRFTADNSNYFDTDGYLDDFRLTPGVARYTSNFTPPTQSLPTALEGTAEATGTLRTRGYVGAAPALAVDTFATFDPNKLSTGATLSNNDYTLNDGSTATTRNPTKPYVSSGKYYAEFRSDATNRLLVMVLETSDSYMTSGYYLGDGRRWINNVSDSPGASSGVQGDIISVALNADTGTVWYALNGVWQLSATAAEIAAGNTSNAFSTGHTGPFRFGAYDKNDADQGLIVTANFGQDATFNSQESPGTTYTDANGLGEFYYEPPAGFVGVYTTTGDGGMLTLYDRYIDTLT